ncbi:MAG: phage portal protein [Alphaproteobacteria bacterium]
MNKKIKFQENWIDKAVSYVSPQAGLQRTEARVRMALFGGYTGARRDRRQTKSWQTADGSANTVTLPDLPALRERSRDLVRNAPLAGGAINTVVTNVVGTGLRVQSRIDREILKLYLKDDAAADAFERQAERIFRLWANSPDCDVTRTQNFKELQNLILRSCLESGDVFILRRFSEYKGKLIGLSLQIVEADRIENPDFKTDTEKLSGGVEVDNMGAPVAYHIADHHPGDHHKGKNKSIKLPAFSSDGSRQVFHIFTRVRPGLTRGVPYLAPVIESLKQLDKYTEAEIMAAVISSMFTIFVKSEEEEGLGAMSPTQETGGSAKDKDYKIAPGAILDLQPNESIDIADPKRPNQAFDPFVQAILRQVGVALEIPFEILIKHFTASYSAAQAALVEAWKFFSARRTWLADKFCQPVYELVIAEAISKGLLDAPGFFSDPIIRAAYLGAEWIGPPRGQIDQLKEIKAAEIRINLGVSTLAEETAQITGGDWERKHPQSAKEQKMRKEAGLIQDEMQSLEPQNPDDEEGKPKKEDA